MIPSPNSDSPKLDGEDDQSDDSQLIDACLEHKPFAWERFVDRHLVTVLNIIDQMVRASSIHLTPPQQESLAQTVFERIRENDFELLRRFQRIGSFQTYLIICVRRIVLDRWQQGHPPPTGEDPSDPSPEIKSKPDD